MLYLQIHPSPRRLIWADLILRPHYVPQWFRYYLVTRPFRVTVYCWGGEFAVDLGMN